MDHPIIPVPVAMNPQIRLVNFEHVVETLPGGAGNVILELSLFVNHTGNHAVRTLVADDDLRLYKLINVHNVAKLSVAEFFVMPPIIPFSASVFVDGDSATYAENVIASEGRTSIFDPKRMPGASARVIMVPPNEEMLSFSHVVIWRVGVRLFRIRVNKTYSKVSDLEGAFAVFDQFFVGCPFRMNIADESNLHIALYLVSGSGRAVAGSQA
jgi:hypothetical protein